MKKIFLNPQGAFRPSYVNRKYQLIDFLRFFYFMERKYHRYEKWECWKEGFFYNISDKKKNELSQNVYDFFCDLSLVKEYMNLVVEKWIYSCEHNLSNESMNRIAWLGQAAACMFCSANNHITMAVWNTLPIEVRKEADEIAESIINEYLSKHE